MTQQTLAPVAELDEWLSDHFGFRCARTRTVDGVETWARREKVALVTLTIPADQSGTVHYAERSGWRLMDVRVTLERATEPLLPERTIIFPLHPEQTDTLALVARPAFRHTRFYADPRLPMDRVDDLYEAWFRNQAAGGIGRALVAEVGQHPVGFVTVGSAAGSARLSLIAVHADHRGGGVGADLVRAAVTWAHGDGARTIDVVTQAANVGALRTFQRCGFLVRQTELVFHRWVA